MTVGADSARPGTSGGMRGGGGGRGGSKSVLPAVSNDTAAIDSVSGWSTTQEKQGGGAGVTQMGGEHHGGMGANGGGGVGRRLSRRSSGKLQSVDEHQASVASTTENIVIPEIMLPNAEPRALSPDAGTASVSDMAAGLVQEQRATGGGTPGSADNGITQRPAIPRSRRRTSVIHAGGRSSIMAGAGLPLVDVGHKPARASTPDSPNADSGHGHARGGHSLRNLSSVQLLVKRWWRGVIGAGGSGVLGTLFCPSENHFIASIYSYSHTRTNDDNSRRCLKATFCFYKRRSLFLFSYRHREILLLLVLPCLCSNDPISACVTCIDNAAIVLVCTFN